MLRVVMFAAGAGLAPMRGFLQGRAMQKQAGRDVARNVMFFGWESLNGPQQPQPCVGTVPVNKPSSDECSTLELEACRCDLQLS